MANASIIRVLKEIKDLQTSSDLSLAVAHREDNVRNVRALIIGPPETPYQFGFFEFKAKFGDKYPTDAPSVRCLTTNGGRCRFNPNIYASGKVCLSILGTWRGEKGEEWSTAQGLESILISIQSLMSSNPYENEPGFEEYPVSSPDAEAYAAKVRHETIRITVVQRLEQILQISDNDHPTPSTACSPPPLDDLNDDDDNDVKEYDPTSDAYEAAEDVHFDPFVDLYKRRFLWYYDAYLLSIQNASQNVKDGTLFQNTAFEYETNNMRGKFAYKSLRARLQRIHHALEAEKAAWIREGKVALSRDNGTAVNLQHQFEQNRNYYKEKPGASVELSLVDDNPFVWTLTFFGAGETDLYGATINVRLVFSLNFPDQQPRVNVLTPLFHHRISASSRTLCYFPSKAWDVRSHIETIMDTIQEENPAYDPRTLVNPEASALLWGDEAQKKQYRRRLRRSVQDSMESSDDL